MGSPDQNEIKIGSVLGHYRILEKLGAGGMGEVYLAEDSRLERRVAVKILPTEMAESRDRMSRFVREAKAASSLNHPHIAHIYEIGESDGINFIAMEYVDGVTLRDKIHREQASLRTLLILLGQVADGLAKAHGRGIIHRDLKPDNIIISRDRYAKILDFGLAKHVEAEFDPSGEAGSEARTVVMEHDVSKPGTVMGTAGYMSPEQALGSAKVDQRSDIFAFGCLLYEAATGGRQAFPGESAIDSMYKILHSQPQPISHFDPNAPADLQRIVRRCLRKEPDDRYQTIKDVAIEIREVLEEMKEGGGPVHMSQDSGPHPPARPTAVDNEKWTGEGPRPAASDPAAPTGRSTQEITDGPRPARSKGAVVAIAAIVLLAVGGASFGLYRYYAVQPTSGREVSKTIPLTSSPTIERSPALSADGKQIAYVWSGEKNDNVDIYVRITDAGSPVRITSNPARDMSPVWSPDGRFIAFLRGDGADKGFYVVPALGGVERKVADSFGWSGAGVRAQAVDWAADGKSLAVVDKGSDAEPWSIFQIVIETGERRRLTSPPSDHDGDTMAAFSPDGGLLGLLRRRDASTSDIFVMPAGGGEPEKVTTDGVAIRGFDWTADGARIAFSSERGGGTSTLWTIPAEGGSPSAAAGTGENLSDVTVASRGNRLAYAQINTDINLWRVANAGPSGGAAPTKFGSSNRSEIDPHYSAAGDRVVFSSNRSGGSEIWVCDAEGTSAIQLTNFGSSAVTGSPRWSPDGRSIAFDSRVGGNADIYIIGADGGTPRRLTTDPSEEVVPSWSADGQFVYYASRRSGRLEIWRSPVAGGEPSQVTRNGGFVSAESPDGRVLYFTKGGAVNGLWQISPSGGEETRVIEVSVGRNWAADAKGIYYLSTPGSDSEPYSILFFDLASRQTTRLFQIPASTRTLPINVLSITPEARSFLYAQRDQLDYDILLVDNFRY